MRTLLTITLLTITSAVFGQNNCGLKGLVTDMEGYPFAGLKIEIADTDGQIIAVFTDQKGMYDLKNLKCGAYTLTLQQPGYKKYVFEVTILQNEIKTFDVQHQRDCYVSVKKCPKGHTDNLIPIVYGLPGKKLLRLSERGRVKLGGCSVPDCNPEWYCKKHEVDF